MTPISSRLGAATRILFLRAGLGLGLAAAASTMALAQDKGGRSGPPKEAFTACESRAQNDSCPITTPEGKSIKGTCMATPDKKLACVPKDAPRR
ncbi:hypothetical protein [Paracoccus seriniphilus]|uniref:Uncharacterized protein n=1 Tax=Paracoccus seriniphilus TaxID=184748 RepID=A0A239PV77_9RHOB|nr:hypothetical protein [Paracoccus seriniphilus]WCR15528.1 hypothetical protein JHW44_16145 [Paracoccus seriniphilus]SNT74028.1 hypothetical protein SAMN05444959_106209 [Paracoccus seriniphilus]